MEKKTTLLNEQEIAEVFALYGNCPVKIDDEKEKTTIIEGVIYDFPQLCTQQKSVPFYKAKLILTPISHLTDNEILLLCRAYEKLPFMGPNARHWIVSRDNRGFGKITNKYNEFSYGIDFTDGSVMEYHNGDSINTGTQVNVCQWYFKNRVACPLYFDYGHPANGKTAIDLGIAIPDKKPLDDLLKDKHKLSDIEIIDWYFDKALLGIDLDKLDVLDSIIEQVKHGVI